MPSLRQDILTGRYVIVAGDRQGRPNEFSGRAGPSTPRSGPESCPFCPGHEHQTPPEVLATGRPAGSAADSPGWRVRTIPNKYPAVVSGPLDRESQADPTLRPARPALGAHEVVVCSPDHGRDLARLTISELAELWEVVRQRVRALESRGDGTSFVLVFANQGPEAGATLAHPHLQIISLPVVPLLVKAKQRSILRHHQDHGRCLVCDILATELELDRRVVLANEHWVALAPWASLAAGHLRLIPRRHARGIAQATADEMLGFADILKECLESLQAYGPRVDFNLAVHGSPVAGDQDEDRALFRPELFHWQVELFPRLTRQAGFEAGTGFVINSFPPEEVAARLRPEGR